MSITLNGFPAIFEASVPQFYLSFTYWIIPESLLNQWNSFHGLMSKFEAKLDADSLIYPLSHCESDGRTVHKLRQRCPTNDWLAPRESDCSRMCRKVSSDWLPSYIRVTRPVLELLNMAGYFPDRPCKLSSIQKKVVHTVETVYIPRIFWYIHCVVVL